MSPVSNDKPGRFFLVPVAPDEPPVGTLDQHSPSVDSSSAPLHEVRRCASTDCALAANPMRPGILVEQLPSTPKEHVELHSNRLRLSPDFCTRKGSQRVLRGYPATPARGWCPTPSRRS